MPVGEYRRIVAQLENRPALPALRPESVWHPGLDAGVASLPLSELAGDRPEGAANAQALVAALHLWNDSLDAAHVLVQDLSGSTGSALHGIMHRREGDYDNAKYWFRRAGDHPAWHGLQSRAARWLREEQAGGRLPGGAIGEALNAVAAQGAWNPYLFTDAVAMAVGGSGGATNGAGSAEAGLEALERLQWMELSSFIRYLESRLQ